MTYGIPSHVPAELIRQFDVLTDPELLADPWHAIDRMRGDAPLLWSPEYGGHWIATTADLVREVLQTPEAFRNSPIGIPPINAWPRPLIPLELDGEEHARYRRLLTPLFSPRAIRPLADSVRSRATEMITSFAGDGRAEFQSQLAFPLPSVVFLELFGVPAEKSETFLSWTHDLIHSVNPEAGAAAGAALVGYLTETIADRMSQPADDMISELTRIEAEGRPLTAEELLDMCFVLCLAGLDTVSNQLGVTMLYLARNPGRQQALRDDPSLIDAAIEELLRLYPIVPPTRTLAGDYVLNGVQLKRGDRIMVCTMGATRDPAEFGDPAEAKFDRQGSNWNAAFGLGPHRCLGMHLARQEMRIVLELMATLAPPFRLAPGATWKWRTNAVWGLDRLDLEFIRDDQPPKLP